MVNSVVEKDVTVEGNISSSKGSVEVRGRVVGDVSAQAVTVLQGGTVEGALNARSVTVEGAYSGQIQCEDLRLAASSQVRADVSAQTMSTENGAQLQGNIKVSSQAG